MAEILLHAWILPAVFLFGSAWEYNHTWPDRARVFAVTFGWPITLPGIWLLNRITR